METIGKVQRSFSEWYLFVLRASTMQSLETRRPPFSRKAKALELYGLSP